MPSAKWPKILPPLTPEQQRISSEFMKLWLKELATRKRYGLIENFNQSFAVKHSRPGFKTTLEIGAGLGEHLLYEKLTPLQETNYYANDMRADMAGEIRKRFPRVNTVIGDCQERLPFADGFFDRVVAVHVLEHLANLPAAVLEAHRLLNKQHGQLLVVIPCEGSPAHDLARKISAERFYKHHYGGDYTWFYRREHINLANEVIAELDRFFIVENRSFFPLPFLPFVFNNLIIGLSLVPRSTPLRPTIPSS